jgi:hypothetical protein
MEIGLFSNGFVVFVVALKNERKIIVPEFPKPLHAVAGIYPVDGIAVENFEIFPITSLCKEAGRQQ